MALSVIVTTLAYEATYARAVTKAAIRATLAASADGEADPLAYLRDELSGPHDIADDHARRP